MNIVADLLTIFRGGCVFVILLLGMQQGITVLPSVVFLTVLCWFSDILDGMLARKSHRLTNFGSFDVVFDVGLAIALPLFLFLGGILSLVPVVVVTGLTILFGWIFHSSAPRKLAMGVSYAVFIFVVWQINRKWFLILIGSVLLFMLFFPHRTRQQISEFLGDAGKILKEEHTVQIEKEKEK